MKTKSSVTFIGLLAFGAWSFWPRNYELSAIGASEDVLTLSVSPDGQRAVFTAGPHNDYDLYSVPMNGQGDAVRLNPVGGNVWGTHYWITPDSSVVIYQPYGVGPPALQAVPIDGSGAPAALDTLGLAAFEPQFALGGSHLVFLSVPPSGGALTLWSLPIDGSPRTLLTSVFTNVDLFDHRVVANGELVLYSVNRTVYSVPADGSSAPVFLYLSRDDTTAKNFLVTPDGTQAVYIDVAGGVYQESTGAGTPLQLNPPFAAGRSCAWIHLSPDGTRVLYYADQDIDEHNELYSVPVGGGAAVKLNDDLTPGGLIYFFEITPDSQRVVYTADTEGDGLFELFTVPIAGGSAPVKLNAPLGPTADVGFFRISPDGARVAFAADLEVDEAYELHSVPIDGSAPPVQLSGVSFPPANVWSEIQFSFGPDSAFLVYSTDADGVPFDSDIHEPVELYAVPADGSAPSVPLSGPLTSGGSVVPIRVPHGISYCAFNARGSRIAYKADQDQDQTFELFGALLPTRPRAQLAR